MMWTEVCTSTVAANWSSSISLTFYPYLIRILFSFATRITDKGIAVVPFQLGGIGFEFSFP